MPDDDLLLDSTTDPDEPEGSAGGADPGNGGSGDGAPPGGGGDNRGSAAVSDADTLREALQGALSPIQEQVNQLAQQFQELRQGGGSEGDNGVPNGQNPNQPDDFSALYTNPEDYIRRTAMDEVRRRVGPALQAQFEQGRDDILREYQGRIDGDLGQGTWGEHFDGEVREILKGLPVEWQGSRKHVEAAVATVLGRHQMDPETRDKLEDRRREARKAQNPSPTMMTGYRLPNQRPRGQLAPEEKSFLADLQKSFPDFDAKRYLAARERGGNEEAWRKARANGAAGGQRPSGGAS